MESCSSIASMYSSLMWVDASVFTIMTQQLDTGENFYDLPTFIGRPLQYGAAGAMVSQKGDDLFQHDLNSHVNVNNRILVILGQQQGLDGGRKYRLQLELLRYVMPSIGSAFVLLLFDMMLLQ